MKNHPCRNHPRLSIALLACAWLAPIAGAMAATGVPPEYQGTWVSAKAPCESPVRARISGDKLTLDSGNDSESLGGIEMAGPGYFAHDYKGIMAVLLTEFDGEQPAMVTFNVGEKKGTAQIDFAPVMPGKATPLLAKYNARISKLNLAARFPLNKVVLKRCAAR
jgi:hypothetical protein